MVERRPWLNLLSHAVLLLGVAVVAFPVYLTFVAASHTAEAIVQAPMPLLPGVCQNCETIARAQKLAERAPPSIPGAFLPLSTIRFP